MLNKRAGGWILWMAVTLAIIILLLLTILTHMDPDGEYSGIHKTTTPRTATIVLIDGLSGDIFRNMIDEGKLPHLAELIGKSTYISNGIGSFPSMTGYAFYPFITGMDAPESGIYGLRWFDRSRNEGNLRNYVGRTNIQMNADITHNYLNLFELSQEYYTASVNTYMNRGVHHSLKTGWAHTTAKYSEANIFPFLRAVPYIGNEICKDHFDHETLVTDLACQQLEYNPKVQWITYPSLDAHNHVHGTNEEYYELLVHIDNQVGRLINKIASLGQDDRMIAVVSDHGILDVHKNIDIPGKLGNAYDIKLERGKSAHLGTGELTTPLEDFIGADGYFVINGNLCAYLYMKDKDLKGATAWRSRLVGEKLTTYPVKGRIINIPEYLSGIEGVEMAAYMHTPGTIRILRKDQVAEISLTANDSLTYTPILGDPLNMAGYLNSGQGYSPDSILSLTAASEYPYGVARLWALMTRENSPDIVITTMPGYDLAKDYELFVENYKGGHGGIHSSLLNVPYILYLPGVPSKHIEIARSEDIGATIIDYLGIELPYDLTGHSLLSK